MTALPDRLALVGDVHANLLALDAVLAAVEGEEIRAGAFTGDLVMRGPDPVAVVARVRALGWPSVAGNTDVKVAGNRALGVEASPPRPPKHPASSRVGSRSWTMRELPPSAMDFLADLPMVERVALGGRTVAVVHGSPEDPSERVEPEADHGRLRELAAELGADCVVTGHTHRAHAFDVDGVLFVNPGAVGEGRDGDRRPHWAWLEAGPDGLVVHMERVEAPLSTERAPES